MKFNFKFRKMKSSEELISYFEQRFEKIRKFETKPVQITATFSVERHSCRVQVHISGREIQMRASASAPHFFEAIEQVTQRSLRQLSRKKARIQNHKCYARSKAGRLENMTEDMEYLPPKAA